MTNTNNIKLIGVGGYARAGKDTFVKIASKILRANGYATYKVAFADGLKNDLDPWVKEKYGISAWTDNNEEKALIRPLLVAHGCGKRNQTGGTYWIHKIDQKLTEDVANLNVSLKDNPSAINKVAYFVSDVRFQNEAEWVHSWGGWVVHLKKYSIKALKEPTPGIYVSQGREYDVAPNEEEAKNDPLLQKQADFFLELQDVSQFPDENGNKITPATIVDNSYLNKEIKSCLINCPFLSIQM
jgi:hypothetical protein